MSPLSRVCFVVHAVLLVHISSSELATTYCGENEALTYVRSGVYDGTALKDDLKSALMHGWWEVAEELIAMGRKSGISLTSVVYRGLDGHWHNITFVISINLLSPPLYLPFSHIVVVVVVVVFVFAAVLLHGSQVKN